MHAALAPWTRDAGALRAMSRIAVAAALVMLGACASRDGLAPAGTLRGADTLAASRRCLPPTGRPPTGGAR